VFALRAASIMNFFGRTHLGVTNSQMGVHLKYLPVHHHPLETDLFIDYLSNQLEHSGSFVSVDLFAATSVLELGTRHD
jgi:hypothetical protein